MTIVVNGDELRLDEPVTLAGLLALLQIDPRRVAVEHNGAIVRRDRFAASLVQAGDRIEIVNFVGGG